MVNHYKIEIIKDYLIHFDKYLKEKTSEIQDKIYDWQNSEKEKEYAGLDYYFEDYKNYSSDFKKLKLESTFLSSFSAFEHYLKSFVEIYKDHFQLEINLDDLSGNNYINKSKTYLEKAVVIDLKSLNTEWKEITKYQRIRNKIIHNNGKFNSKEVETIKELSKMEGIDISLLGWITLTDKQFIFQFWSIVNKYIEGIIHLTKEKINFA